MCPPFTSVKVSAPIRQCLIQAQPQDGVLLNISDDNIGQQLVRNKLYDKTCVSRNCIVCPNGEIVDFAKPGVVDQIECSAGHADETGRFLSVIINQHLARKSETT